MYFVQICVSLFSFISCWNFTWAFTEVLTEIFKLTIHNFPQENPGEIATIQNPCMIFPSQKALPSLWRGVGPVMSSQADLRVLQNTWGLVPPKPCQKFGQ